MSIQISTFENKTTLKILSVLSHRMENNPHKSSYTFYFKGTLNEKIAEAIKTNFKIYFSLEEISITCNKKFDCGTPYNGLASDLYETVIKVVNLDPLAKSHSDFDVNHREVCEHSSNCPIFENLPEELGNCALI